MSLAARSEAEINRELIPWLMEDIRREKKKALAGDPLQWVMQAFPWGEGELKGIDGPDTWQTEALESIRDQLQTGASKIIIQEAVASGHGIGKSALVAWLIIWAMDTMETMGAVTANTERQLKTKTWSQMSKWFRLCKFKDNLKLEATSIFSSLPGRSGDWRVDQVPWSERTTEGIAGLHNEGKRVLIVFDEASALPDKIWEVYEGSLTGETGQVIWVVFGNPTRNTGRFKECFSGKIKLRWNRGQGGRQIDSRTCRFSDKEQIQKWAEDYGEDSDFFKVRVRGMFPAMSAKQFISVTDVDAAYGRVVLHRQYDFAPKILTVDPAWEGDDEFVIGLRQGIAFWILRTFAKNNDDFRIAGLIAQLEDEHQADAVFIDFGYGTGIASAGKTLGRKHWRLVQFGGESPEPGYLNMRAYMWGQMAKWLREGGAIPEDQVLYNDLIGPETIFRADGKIQLESKKDMKARGLASPGRADCLAISFAYPVRLKSAFDKVKEDWGRSQNEYDPLKQGWNN